MTARTATSRYLGKATTAPSRGQELNKHNIKSLENVQFFVYIFLKQKEKLFQCFCTSKTITNNIPIY